MKFIIRTADGYYKGNGFSKLPLEAMRFDTRNEAAKRCKLRSDWHVEEILLPSPSEPSAYQFEQIHVVERMSMKTFIAVLFMIVMLQGCAAGGSTSTPPNQTYPNMQGAWEMKIGDWIIEANLTQSGQDVSATPVNIAMFPQDRSSYGSSCGGTTTLSGTVPTTLNGSITLTLTETGPAGTSVSTITGPPTNTDNNTVQLVIGTFTTSGTPTCGISVGNGGESFKGTLLPPADSPFSAQFTGNLNSGTAAITPVPGPNNTITISGNVNGYAVSMSGDLIGNAFTTTGTVGTTQTSWNGLVTTTASQTQTTFRLDLYDGGGHWLGFVSYVK